MQISQSFLNEIYSSDLYLYHYTNISNLDSVKKYGLLSIFALYKKDHIQYQQVLDYYEDRIRKKLNKKYGEITIEDFTKFFEDKGLDIKSIFFSFWEIVPGLNKERDLFVKQSILLKLSLAKLEKNWKYMLVYKNKISNIEYSDIFKFCKQDSLQYQKHSGGKFLFTNLPHVCVITPNGVIEKQRLEFS